MSKSIKHPCRKCKSHVPSTVHEPAWCRLTSEYTKKACEDHTYYRWWWFRNFDYELTQ